MELPCSANYCRQGILNKEIFQKICKINLDINILLSSFFICYGLFGFILNIKTVSWVIKVALVQTHY